MIRTDDKANPIARFQAAHPPGRPLAELTKAEANKALVAIVDKLDRLLGPALP